MLLAQQGNADGDKTATGLSEQILDGLIVSPKNLIPRTLETNMVNFAANHPNSRLYFDPQFYSTVFAPRNIGKLKDYVDFYPTATLRRQHLQQASDVRIHVERVLDYQALRPIHSMISPSVMVGSLSDTWSRIAMTFAEESSAYHKVRGFDPDLLVTIAFDETCLRDFDTVESYLDELTTLDVAGFYLLVRRNDEGYQASTEQEILVNLLYLTHALSEVNGYRVIAGYSDFIGVGLVAAGAEAIATGWDHTLRQFSMRRWEPNTGGQQPNPRYSSGPMMNTLLVSPELDFVYDAGFISRVITGTSRDGDFLTTRPSAVSWSKKQWQIHHWEVINGLQRDVQSAGSFANRFGIYKSKVNAALDLYDEADRHGVVFDVASSRREISTMSEALDDFRALV